MSILARAELLLQAKNYSGSGDWLDESGNGHDAVFNGPSAFNEPVQVIHLPGIAANYVSAPDIAAYDLNDTFFLAAYVAFDDWTPSGNTSIVSQWVTTGDQRAYSLGVSAGGQLRFSFSSAGTAATVSNLLSSAGHGFTDGTGQWVGAEFDAGVIRFFTGGTNVTTPVWVELGTGQTGSGVTCHNSTGALEIGSRSDGTAQLFSGKVYRIIMYSDTTRTTTVFDADFTDRGALTKPFATFTEGSSNMATVTLNRSATGRKLTVVDRPLMLLGTDDYFEILDDAQLDFAAGDDFTVMAWGRNYDWAAVQMMVAKKVAGPGATDAGYHLLSNAIGASRLSIADGAVQANIAGPLMTDGQAAILAGVRNTGNDDIEAFTDGTGSGSPASDVTTVTLANAEVMRIGARSGIADDFFDGEIFAVAIWREALSDADVVTTEIEVASIHLNELMLLGVG